MDNKSDEFKLRESIRKLERKLGILNESEMSCCSVTLAQCHAIIEIGNTANISLNQLADILNLDNSTMSRTVNNLVNSGHVKREIDSQDRRYLTISLTEEGQKVFEQIESSMGIYFKVIHDRIPENKRMQVLESLEILIKAVGKVERN